MKEGQQREVDPNLWDRRLTETDMLALAVCAPLVSLAIGFVAHAVFGIGA